MNIPSLPTDNLYKFLAIFGLILIVLSLHFMNQTYNPLISRINELEVQDLIHQIQSLQDTVSVEVKIEKIIHENEVAQIFKEVDKYPKLIWRLIVLLFLGVFLSLLGFICWYHRTQKLQDQILKNQKNKIIDDRSILVHSMQFEKEFEVYKAIWPLLLNLRQETFNLRPSLKTQECVGSEETIRKKKLEAYSRAFSSVLNQFENNKPFYPDGVYKAIGQVIRISKRESIEFKFLPTTEMDYYKNGERNMNQIIEGIDIVCEKIRDRIGILKIENRKNL